MEAPSGGDGRRSLLSPKPGVRKNRPLATFRKNVPPYRSAQAPRTEPRRPNFFVFPGRAWQWPRSTGPRAGRTVGTRVRAVDLRADRARSRGLGPVGSTLTRVSRCCPPVADIITPGDDCGDARSCTRVSRSSGTRTQPEDRATSSKLPTRATAAIAMFAACRRSSTTANPSHLAPAPPTNGVRQRRTPSSSSRRRAQAGSAMTANARPPAAGSTAHADAASRLAVRAASAFTRP